MYIYMSVLEYFMLRFLVEIFNRYALLIAIMFFIQKIFDGFYNYDFHVRQTCTLEPTFKSKPIGFGLVFPR